MEEEWSELQDMVIGKHGTKAVSVGGRIYIPGGGLQQDGVEVETGQDGVVRGQETSDGFEVFVVGDDKV